VSSGRPETRSAILEAARRLLETRGTPDLELEEVAREAGVSRQAVYLHFGKRSGLLLALAQYVDEAERLAEAARQVRQARTGVEELDAFITLQAEYTPRIAALAKVFDEGRRRDPALAAGWEDRMRQRQKACTRIVTRLRDEGSLASCWSIADAADVLWELTSIRSWEDLTHDRGWSKKRYTKLLQRIARRALLAAAPPGRRREPQ
jgi:AcrR family transcriptional regulator